MDLPFQKRIQSLEVQENSLEQSSTGIPEFKIANLFEDIEMLKSVQSVAIKIMEDDPELEKEKNIKLKEQIEEKFKERIEIQNYMI